MGKRLSEMTLEELWQLFPIYLTEHQSCWQEWYSEEERLLKNALSSTERISHIGSTAVSSIWAKPIIDILVEAPKESRLLDYKDLIIKLGGSIIWICSRQQGELIGFRQPLTLTLLTRPMWKLSCCLRRSKLRRKNRIEAIT